MDDSASELQKTTNKIWWSSSLKETLYVINGQVAIWTQTLQVYLGRVVSKALFKQTLDILYNTGMLLV